MLVERGRGRKRPLCVFERDVYLPLPPLCVSLHAARRGWKQHIPRGKPALHIKWQELDPKQVSGVSEMK